MGYTNLGTFLDTVDPSRIIREKVKDVGKSTQDKAKLIQNIEEVWEIKDSEGVILGHDLDPESYGLNWLQQLWPLVRHWPKREEALPILIAQVKARLDNPNRTIHVEHLVQFDMLEIRKKYKIYSAKELKKMKGKPCHCLIAQLGD